MTSMSTLTARVTMEKQIVLPWSKAVEIAVESLKVRFGRSLITSASIALATAFFMYTLANQDVIRRLVSLNDADVNFLLQRRGIDLDEAGQGMGARDLWIIATSMVVCLVGVSNALLMSVTERIKEIGTMKCLGALNSFVVKLFLIEALLLGGLSSSGGAVLGLACCVAIAWASYGVVAVSRMPWMALATAAGITLALGTVLSVLAAIYPSLLAARMQPVEAMRKEV
jgi:hypothetical protein